MTMPNPMPQLFSGDTQLGVCSQTTDDQNGIRWSKGRRQWELLRRARVVFYWAKLFAPEGSNERDHSKVRTASSP